MFNYQLKVGTSIISPTGAIYGFVNDSTLANTFVYRYDGNSKSISSFILGSNYPNCSSTLSSLIYVFAENGGSGAHYIRSFNGSTLTYITTMGTPFGIPYITDDTIKSAETLGSAIYILHAQKSTSPYNRLFGKFEIGTLSTVEYTITDCKTSASCVLGSNIIYFGTGTDSDATYYGYDDIMIFDGTTLSLDSLVLASVVKWAGASTLSGNSYIFGGSRALKGAPYTTSYLDTIQKYTGTAITTESAVLSQASVVHTAETLSSNIFIFNGTGTQRFNGTTCTVDEISLGVNLTCAAVL